MRSVINSAEPRIAQGDEAPRSNAVGDVAKLLRPELGEIAKHGLLEQLGVQRGDTVDRVAADDGEIRHPDGARAAFIDQGKPRDALVVAGIILRGPRRENGD